jgi:capreomycidine synthase
LQLQLAVVIVDAMALPKILLEEWMRHYYFAAEVDIGSSGVENFSMSDLRELLGFSYDDLDRIVLRDSESLGGAGVRRALARRWLAGKSDHVLVTHGSSEAIYLALTTLLTAGDEVVVLDPCYPQHYSIAEAMGCRVRFWPLRFERGFRPDLAEARELIGPRTRMVVVNFPNNPTGASLTPEELAELLALVEAADAYLVWDAAFSELTYEAPPLPEPLLLSPRVLSIGTLSKAYGLPGLRVGWCFALPELLARMIETRDHVTLHLSPLVEFVAAHAIAQGERILAPRLAQARQNRARVARWVEEQEGRVEWVPPVGGVCAFIRLPGVEDVDAFCHRLARESGTLLIPGSCFRSPQHARLGFGDSSSTLEVGLARLAERLRAEAPGPLAGDFGDPDSIVLLDR